MFWLATEPFFQCASVPHIQAVGPSYEKSLHGNTPNATSGKRFVPVVFLFVLCLVPTDPLMCDFRWAYLAQARCVAHACDSTRCNQLGY